MPETSDWTPTLPLPEGTRVTVLWRDGIVTECWAAGLEGKWFTLDEIIAIHLPVGPHGEGGETYVRV